MIIINLSPHCDPLANLGEPDAGGQCVYEQQLGLALSEHNNATVFTFCRDIGQRPKLSVVNDNYFIFRITAGPKHFIPKEELEPFMSEFADQVKQYIEMLEPARNEIAIHAHYWDGARIALELASSMKFPIPIVWTPHSLGTIKQRKFQGLGNEMKYNFIPRKIWENYIVHLADALIVSSVGEAQELEDQYGAHKNKISVIKPGIDLGRLTGVDKKEARSRLGLPQDLNILTCFGRIAPTKGYERAILGFSRLPQAQKDQSRLVICGGNPENPAPEEEKYFGRLERLVLENELEDYVIFLQSLPYESANLIYAASDIFLSTSLQEPYGLTIKEAMASGTPVIVDSTAGCKQLVKSNKTGLVVDTSNQEELANAIQKILTNPKLANQMGKRGQQLITKDFSWAQKVKEFSEIYQTITPLSNTRYYRNWIENQTTLSKLLGGFSSTPKIPKQIKIVSPKVSKKGLYANSTSRTV